MKGRARITCHLYLSDNGLVMLGQKSNKDVLFFDEARNIAVSVSKLSGKRIRLTTPNQTVRLFISLKGIEFVDEAYIARRLGMSRKQRPNVIWEQALKTAGAQDDTQQPEVQIDKLFVGAVILGTAFYALIMAYVAYMRLT